MKILLVHNFYGSAAPSGENTVFAAEKKLLADHGHEVVAFTRHSDEIRNQGVWGTVKGAICTPWNPFSGRQLSLILARERPDIMHVHNTFPLLSPAIFHAARQSPAVVLTLHNYRNACAAGTPQRQERPCTECIDSRRVFPAVRYGCYRRSRVATLPLAVMVWLHRRLGTWHSKVDAFIVLTEFQKRLMTRGGFPAGKLHVKPHFYPDPPEPVPWKERLERIVMVGRLSAEKGVRFLLEAWRVWGGQAPLLEVIGDGELRRELEEQSRSLGDRVRFLGQLPYAETQKRIGESRLLALPSICFEGFPMVLREALALGVPAAVSDLGAMPSIIEENVTGVLFKPGDALDMQRKISALWRDGERLALLAQNARKEYEKKYTAEANYERLMEVYSAAVAARKGRGGDRNAAEWKLKSRTE